MTDAEWVAAFETAIDASDPARAEALLLEVAERRGTAKRVVAPRPLSPRDRVPAENLAHEKDGAEVFAPPRSDAAVGACEAAAIRRRAPLFEALIYAARGEHVRAAETFERARAHRRAADAWRDAGDLHHAVRALERHLAYAPDDHDARLALVTTLLDLDRAQAALHVLQSDRAQSRGAPSDAARALATRALRALGLHVGAPIRPPTDEAPSALLFGRFEIVREVATGPSSRLLEAHDRLRPRGDTRVALKVFRGEAIVGMGRDALQRFEREFQAILAIDPLDSASLLRPLEVIDEGPTIVLPWMRGGSLADALDRDEPVAARALEILRRVLEALDAAHRRSIVHRDVKSSNILLDGAGAAFLGDFGAAHFADASTTATAGPIGTWRSMAPEQRRGEAATARSDLFSVGVIALELLGLTSLDEVASAMPPVDARVRALLASLLAESPDDRPADAAEALAQVGALAAAGVTFQRCRRDNAAFSSRAAHRNDARFHALGADRVRDSLLDRDELWIAPTDPRFPLARALATLCHPNLPEVFGVDVATGALRVEVIESADATEATGATETAPTAPTRDELAAVESALTALRALGVARVVETAAARLGRRCGRPVLAFPERLPERG